MEKQVQSNKILKLLIISVLTMCMTITSFVFDFTKASAATDEVALSSTNTKMIDAAGGLTVYKLTAKIKVKNLAYDKKVTLHYYDSYGLSKWTETEATYKYSLDDGYEIWEVSAVYAGDYLQFAIEYEVNGQTYWDNNNQKDYFVYKEHNKTVNY